jgi:hypothetical protein
MPALPGLVVATLIVDFCSVVAEANYAANHSTEIWDGILQLTLAFVLPLCDTFGLKLFVQSHDVLNRMQVLYSRRGLKLIGVSLPGSMDSGSCPVQSLAVPLTLAGGVESAVTVHVAPHPVWWWTSEQILAYFLLQVHAHGSPIVLLQEGFAVRALCRPSICRASCLLSFGASSTECSTQGNAGTMGRS